MFKKNDKILHDELLKKSLVSKKDLEALSEEVLSTGASLQQLLVKHRLLDESEILRILAKKLKLTCVDVKSLSPDKAVLDRIPAKVALYYKFVPLRIDNRTLTIAVSAPLDLKKQDEIRAQLGYHIETALSCDSDIMECLKKNYGLAAETLTGITSKQAPAEDVGLREPDHERVEDIEKLAGDASVIRLVNQIILEGWKKRATDIHIEPHRGKVSLRYRVDGILYDAPVPPEIKNFLNAIISRIKIMSNLNIVERRTPQDGRAVVRAQDQVLDLRISTLPTPFGESIVIRILPTQMLYSLEKLGLSKSDLEVFQKQIIKPHGIIFVTGPTGSGKTTTLYACLNTINTKERKIVTIEDPIEYEMQDIVQMQVMPDIGLDFARGLRSVLRHDPDVIMVGEVRDLETAEIAIRVALTGHLIFSTLHTNDAASGITRLIDIGIEPYLVTSSIEAFIAQRLIRVICPNCKFEDKSAPPELKAMIAKESGLKPDTVRIFRGKGCSACNDTGFFGRTAIYEILLVDEAIKELILRKRPSNEIKKMARSRGMQTLRQDGWKKVISGISTPEEVMNATPAEEEARGRITLRPFDDSGLKDALTGHPPARQEKRTFTRLENKIDLHYKIFSAKREELSALETEASRFSVTKNISAGGLLFIAFESLAVGSILELRIEVPDSEKPVTCLSKVVRVEEIMPESTYDIAVCFLDIAGSQRARLQKYIEQER